MTDTTTAVTSDVKSCVQCGAAFGEQDDKRFNQCKACRIPATEETVSETVTETLELEMPETKTEAETLSTSGVEPVILDIQKCSPPPLEERDFYWCGATDDCPMLITLGGFEFENWGGNVVRKHDGNSVLQERSRLGKIHRLTETNVALIKEHCANKVIRNFHTDTKQLLSGETITRFRGMLKGMTGSKHRKYIPHPDDKPLGQFVFMIKVRHANDRPYENPPTMVPRDW